MLLERLVMHAAGQASNNIAIGAAQVDRTELRMECLAAQLKAMTLARVSEAADHMGFCNSPARADPYQRRRICEHRTGRLEQSTATLQQ